MTKCFVTFSYLLNIPWLQLTPNIYFYQFLMLQLPFPGSPSAPY